MSKNEKRLTIAEDIVEPHWSVVDVTDVSHATVNVKTFNKHPTESTQKEVVEYDCNQCANDLKITSLTFHINVKLIIAKHAAQYCAVPGTMTAILVIY